MRKRSESVARRDSSSSARRSPNLSPSNPASHCELRSAKPVYRPVTSWRTVKTGQRAWDMTVDAVAHGKWVTIVLANPLCAPITIRFARLVSAMPRIVSAVDPHSTIISGFNSCMVSLEINSAKWRRATTRAWATNSADICIPGETYSADVGKSSILAVTACINMRCDLLALASDTAYERAWRELSE